MQRDGKLDGFQAFFLRMPSSSGSRESSVHREGVPIFRSRPDVAGHRHFENAFIPTKSVRWLGNLDSLKRELEPATRKIMMYMT